MASSYGPDKAEIKQHAMKKWGSLNTASGRESINEFDFSDIVRATIKDNISFTATIEVD